MINRYLSELKRRGVIQTLTAYVVTAWLVIEVLDIAGPMFAMPGWVNTVVGVAVLAGFPVAAYLSWFFNYSDGTFSRALDKTGTSTQPLNAWHWAGLGIITTAAISAGYYLYDDISDRLRKSEDGILVADIDDSVAIVPFVDLSPEQDQVYLAEGIAAEVASILGRTSGVRTAATSASFRLARNGQTPLDVARGLSMATVLTGTVNAAGNRVRIRAELLNSSDGRVLWNDSFTRTLDDVFAMEQEIARSIANTLLDQYVESSDITPQAQTASSDAYVFYLKGRAAMRNRTAEDVKVARKLFEQSVALDPEYAPALVGVAESMWQLAEGGTTFGNLDREVAATVARRSVERALLINDSLPEAYANLGQIEALLQQYEKALAHYDKAIVLNPSLVDVHVWRYLALNNLGRYREAMDALQKAATLDPTAPTILHNLGYEFSERGDYEAAREMFDKLIASEPDNPLGHRGLATAAFREGDLALSLEQWARARELSPETPLYTDSYRDVLFSLQMLEEFRPLALATGEEVNVMLLEGDFAAIEEKMRFEMAANPDDPWLQFEAGWYRYFAGDTQGGDELVLAADAIFSDADRFAMPMCSPAIETAFALKNAGQIDKAKAYIDRCANQLATARQSVFQDSFLDHLGARIAALRNEPEEAVAHMERAFENGWREWWTELDPVLAPLAGNPAMVRVFTRIKKEIDRQRALVSISTHRYHFIPGT